MIKALVGYTGFVGSNLLKSCKFDKIYNSKNIQESYGTKPDLLIYAGVPSEMFTANNNPEKDLEIIKNAIVNIEKIQAKKVVLISTVAVYGSCTQNVDENTIVDEKFILPYGKNRLYLEKWVKENCVNSLIVRLPAIYGENLKKNYIYDLINYFPALLTQEKYNNLSQKNSIIKEFYIAELSGYYRLNKNALNKDDRKNLKKVFEEYGFSALNFTDSRSVYQYYNLKNLWSDVEILLNENIRIINLVTEPVSSKYLYKKIMNEEFNNELNREPFNYDIRTVNDYILKGKNGYIQNKDDEINELCEFIKEEKKKLW